jgi:enoyl-CoA hydratase/carnithine racemase
VTQTEAEPVLYDVADGVATLTLNNPERRNAWNLSMEHRYFELLDEASTSPGVRAIVVTGAGTSFCPGMDMVALAGTAESGELVRAGRRPMHFAMSVPKPMIAAINGPCAGIGLIQAVYCDVRTGRCTAVRT